MELSLLPPSQVSRILDIISDDIEMALSFLPSANIFVIGDFNAHHDTWLKHLYVTDAVSIQTLNFSTAQSLIQIISLANPSNRLPY